MQDKYENKNFGGMQKRGAEDKGRTYANDSFEEYAKQFMQYLQKKNKFVFIGEKILWHL